MFRVGKGGVVQTQNPLQKRATKSGQIFISQHQTHCLEPRSNDVINHESVCYEETHHSKTSVSLHFFPLLLTVELGIIKAFSMCGKLYTQ